MASCAFTSGDLFCTHTSTWWPILYMRIIVTLWIIFFYLTSFFFTYFMAYRSEDLFTYSVQLPPIYTFNPPFFTYFLWVPLLHDLVCTHETFMAYFVYLYLLGLIFTYFMGTSAHTSCDLFCTHTSSWWPILYTRNFLIAYSVNIPPYVDLCRISVRSKPAKISVLPS